jgi:hypothetical protein
MDVYAAAVSDLTEDGREELPGTRAAKARVQAPFQLLPSITHSDLALAIVAFRPGAITAVPDGDRRTRPWRALRPSGRARTLPSRPPTRLATGRS